MEEKTGYLQKIKVLVLTLLIVGLMAFTLTACGEESNKITFYVDNNVYYTAQINDNGRLAFPLDPVKKDYEFAGWILDDNLKNMLFSEDLDFSKLNSSLSVYAKFVALPQAPHIVISEFDKETNNVYGMYLSKDDTSIDFNNYISTPTNEFGWELIDSTDFSVIENKVGDLVKGVNVFYVDFTPVGGKATRFTFNLYVGIDMPITFNTDGGTPLIESTTAEYGEFLEAPNVVLTKVGYDFAGWDFDFTKPVTRASIIKALWTPKEYSITYNLNSGTNSNNNPSAFTIESGAIVFENASRTGYEFKGWYNNANFDEQVYGVDAGSYSNVEVFAKWQIIEYTITYHLNGGRMDASTTQIITIETDAIKLPTPTKDDCDFLGWYLEDATAVLLITPNRNYDLYASWQDNSSCLVSASTFRSTMHNFLIDNNCGESILNEELLEYEGIEEYDEYDYITTLTFDKLSNVDVTGMIKCDTNLAASGNAIYMYLSGTDLYVLSETTICLPADCSYMFANASSHVSYVYQNNLTAITFNNISTSNVTNMHGMFYSNTSGNSLNAINGLTKFDTSNVSDMGWMFAFRQNLTTLDLTSFTTSQNTNMQYMFYNCSGMQHIYIDYTHTAFYVVEPNEEIGEYEDVIIEEYEEGKWRGYRYSDTTNSNALNYRLLTGCGCYLSWTEIYEEM